MNAAVKDQNTVSFEEASRPLIKFYAAMLLEEEKNGNLDAFAEEIDNMEDEGRNTNGYTFQEFIKKRESNDERALVYHVASSANNS